VWLDTVICDAERRVSGLALVLVTLMVVSLGTGAAPAGAHWARIAMRPSTASPYAVCPPRPRDAHCQAIEDPTRGTARRGPVAAGAITAGPEQEASPELSGHGVEGGYAAADLTSAYSLSTASETAGGGQTVAIVDAFDDPRAEADLNAYRTEYGMPECTTASGCFAKVNEAGGTAYPAEHRAEWELEVSVDMDMVSAICPKCHVLLVEAANAEPANLALAEDEAVKLHATEISDSFAEPENSEQAAAYDHPGIPIAVAGGDASYGQTVSPAASPHVIAVGGTTLLPATNRRGWSESVWWDEGSGQFSGTGSGCTHEAKPWWQGDAGCAQRTDNDVAAVADPNTPVSVYDGNEKSPWRLVGGTSVAAPMVAAAMALSDPYTRDLDGAQALYAEAATFNGFNDILTGANGRCGSYLCEAGYGYDGPTGLGSLQGAPAAPLPSAVTGSAGAIGATEAVLQATVDTHDAQLAACVFEYGPTVTYGHQVPCSALPPPGNVTETVTARAERLTPTTGYHFRIVITYPGGASEGSDSGFTTTGAPPAVATTSASAITQIEATLDGSVDFEGGSPTVCRFEYGPTTAYGSSATCAGAPSGTEERAAVSALASGLTPDQTYHFRLVAADANGTSYGADVVFTTLPTPPVVATRPPTALEPYSATLNATVVTGGAPVTGCQFELDSASELIPCATLPTRAEGVQALSAVARGLAAGTSHRYRILVTNAGGAGVGRLVEFSTPAAPELLSPPPPAIVPPPTGPVDPPSAEARLSSNSLIVGAGGVLRAHVHCATGIRACHGVLALASVGAIAVPARPGKHVLTYASASFAAGAGATVVVRLKLSAAARTLLARAGRLRGRASIRALPANGALVAWNGTVTLRASQHS
jgi:hypothetical protein